ncbi:unnamed protein product [Vitrella brassicaformis CCMP3155]|uniref:Uncharacterized protein n=2 Tax=Vitrella brassicaformis TaxID=1169539 RepID=A0A0G4GYD4_VITBC|nr:unnamed protein product [Vitrella brassicaformis CCMP3155]|eukprot:CEM36141.1 unnamed protein product [Vitrella brassicaformis CCMP3155]
MRRPPRRFLLSFLGPSPPIDGLYEPPQQRFNKDPNYEYFYDSNMTQQPCGATAEREDADEDLQDDEEDVMEREWATEAERKGEDWRREDLPPLRISVRVPRGEGGRRKAKEHSALASQDAK